MPVHPKFTKEQVIDAAYEILRQEGVEALTARHLGEVLGSSARPVFTLFLNMNEVKVAAMEKVRKIYNTYINKGLEQKQPFKGAELAYIQFAMDEPYLFKILFMTLRTKGKAIPPERVLQSEDNYKRIVNSLKNSYGLSAENAKKLYEYMWVYTHGLATMAATSVGKTFDIAKISDMLTEVFDAVVPTLKIKKEGE